MKLFEIGQKVVRASGGHEVGRTGTIICIDGEKQRARVKWVGHSKTWVSFDVIELTSIPYKIVEPDLTVSPYKRKRGERFPMYVKL